MSKYSSFERFIAKKLEAKPIIRNLIRKSYKRSIYYLHRNKQQCNLNKLVYITDIKKICLDNRPNALFFGYYDKNPLSIDGIKFIGHQISHTLCNITIYDLKDGQILSVIPTHAWNYQQGAMSQWINDVCVIYNTYENNILGCYLYRTCSDQRMFYQYPIQALNPIFNEFLSLNYRRLAKLRPDYGYFLECDNFHPDQDYQDDGIWKVDIRTKQSSLIINLESLIESCPDEFKTAAHKVNHCYYSPNGERFVFLHRWIHKTRKYSRLYCANRNGRNLRLLLDNRMVSHYSWLDNKRLIVWARTPEYGDSYILLNVDTGKYTELDKELSKYGDGHPTIDPTGRFIVTDTYPDKARFRSLLLYDMKKRNVIKIGEFFSPWKYDEEKRCDLHPRWCTKDLISIDSAHEGLRKTYLIDISNLLKTIDD